MSNAIFEITDEASSQFSELVFGSWDHINRGRHPIFSVPGLDAVTGEPVTLVMRVTGKGRSILLAVLLPKFNPGDPLRYRPVSIHKQTNQS